MRLRLEATAVQEYRNYEQKLKTRSQWLIEASYNVYKITTIKVYRCKRKCIVYNTDKVEACTVKN